MNKKCLIFIYFLFIPSFVFSQANLRYGGAGRNSDATIVGLGGWTRTGTNVHLTTITDFVGVGTSSPSGNLHLSSAVSTQPFILSDYTGTGTGNTFRFRRTTNSAEGLAIAQIQFWANNGIGTLDQFANITASAKDTSDGDEAGRADFQVSVNDAMKTIFSIFGNSAGAATAEFLINDTGIDVDFRVETDTDTAAFFVGGDDGNVSIAKNTGDQKLNVLGYVQKQDQKWLDAIAFFPQLTNGAGLDTLNSREEVYDFDSATSESLYVKWHAPKWFTSLDSVKLRVSSGSSDGDSVAFALQGIGIADGEAIGGAVGNATADTLDLGGSANLIKVLTITGTFPTIAAEDVVTWLLRRDISISNDEAGDVSLHSMLLYFK